MNINIITLFPELFESVFSKSIIKRAQDKKLLKIKYVDPRKWGIGKHKQVDDKPYGGGSGMVMMPDPILKSLNSINPKPYTVLLSASGKKYTQQSAKILAKKKNIALICGHYEGVDARVEEFVDETISIGDFVVTGGEIPAMLLVDSVTRLIPEVIKAESTANESFEDKLLEYPQYTRPETYKPPKTLIPKKVYMSEHKPSASEVKGLKVPQVLLSGNHAEIAKWRKEQSKKITKKNRPDLKL